MIFQSILRKLIPPQASPGEVDMRQRICIKKLRGLIVEQGQCANELLATTMNMEMMSLGYIMSAELLEAISTLSEEAVAELHESVISVLRQVRGADVKYKPMYPNFPQQVVDASYLELYRNAFLHYWTFGQWKPDYQERPRLKCFEHTQYTTLTLISESDFHSVFGQILRSNDSISEEDKSIVRWFVSNCPEVGAPTDIPFKENLCLLAALYLKDGRDIEPYINTATDVLRILTYLSDGDISLAENTKFKSMPRAQRRAFCAILEKVASEEDIKRHRKKWVRLFHCLHVGDYSPMLYELAKKARNNIRMDSFSSRVEAAIASNSSETLLELLEQRPSEFARRIDHLARSQGNQQEIMERFSGVADQVPTRILLQLLGHLSTRLTVTDKRIVFPKGNTQRAVIVDRPLEAMDREAHSSVTDTVLATLRHRFAELGPLGNVWVDPELIDCPIPSGQRSASEGLVSVARGTRLPLADYQTLRFFIYWIGEDIDLSATLHDAKFNYIGHVSYTALKSDRFQAYHSGDIVAAPAPQGASEFIDIAIDNASEMGARYLAMNVMVYSGPAFSKHAKCYAGWMGRQHPNSNEIYDPKTVEQKIDLLSNSRNCIPVVFDLKDRSAIWCDLATRSNAFHGGNNVESNKANIKDTLEAIITARGKLSLYELFWLHAEARGNLVKEKGEADIAFSLTGDVTPFDINRIATDFMA